MAKYVDVYIVPIAEEKLAEYKKLAAKAGKIFIRNGAIGYREYVGSDMSSEHGTLPFPKMAKARAGEKVIYAVVEFRSESHRNAAMKKIFADPALDTLMSGPPPINYKRMAYGGFKLLVDAG